MAELTPLILLIVVWSRMQLLAVALGSLTHGLLHGPFQLLWLQKSPSPFKGSPDWIRPTQIISFGLMQLIGTLITSAYHGCKVSSYPQVLRPLNGSELYEDKDHWGHLQILPQLPFPLCWGNYSSSRSFFRCTSCVKGSRPPQAEVLALRSLRIPVNPNTIISITLYYN